MPMLAVAAGSAIAVRGPSGAGKSTFLYAIAGLLPFSGKVRWGETGLAALSDSQCTAFRGDEIGFVFQDHLLFEELAAAENAAVQAAYAPPRAAVAGSFAPRGSGFSTALGCARPNAAVRQRIAVARALSSDPAIVLADEPTANLDRSAAEALTDDLIGLACADGRTLIALSHHPMFHDRADRVIDIVADEVVAEMVHE